MFDNSAGLDLIKARRSGFFCRFLYILAIAIKRVVWREEPWPLVRPLPAKVRPDNLRERHKY